MIIVQETRTELMPEAGGGGNRTRPPVTVITGEHPEDRYERLRRQLEAMRREAERRQATERIDVLKAWFTRGGDVVFDP